MNENVQITHDRLITLENRTAMMAKAIIPILKDFKEQINKTNDRLIRQYRMMTRAYERLLLDYLDKLTKPSKYII